MEPHTLKDWLEKSELWLVSSATWAGRIKFRVLRHFHSVYKKQKRKTPISDPCWDGEGTTAAFAL